MFGTPTLIYPEYRYTLDHNPGISAFVRYTLDTDTRLLDKISMFLIPVPETAVSSVGPPKLPLLQIHPTDHILVLLDHLGVEAPLPRSTGGGG